VLNRTEESCDQRYKKAAKPATTTEARISRPGGAALGFDEAFARGGGERVAVADSRIAPPAFDRVLLTGSPVSLVPALVPATGDQWDWGARNRLNQ
jgi:hypothetical protein